MMIATFLIAQEASAGGQERKGPALEQLGSLGEFLPMNCRHLLACDERDKARPQLSWISWLSSSA